MEIEKSYCVYVHINKENGKRYFGITCQKPEERWRQGRGYKNSDAFYPAIQKYGWDGFDHKILASGLTKEEAENMEIKLICEYQTQNKEYGYNIKEGGGAPQQTDEIKKKISETHIGPLNPMYGKQHTEQEKKNLSEKMSGENNPRYGKKNSDETRRKISEALTGRHLSEEHKQKQAVITGERFKGRQRPDGGGKPPKKIICVETGEVFNSIADAAKAKGIKHKSNISTVAKGKAKTAGGYHWEYYKSSVL